MPFGKPTDDDMAAGLALAQVFARFTLDVPNDIRAQACAASAHLIAWSRQGGWDPVEVLQAVIDRHRNDGVAAAMDNLAGKRGPRS